MYLWLKLAHVVAVILFLGNITTGLFWKAHADRTRDPRIVAHVMDGIIWSDRLFTIPGVLLIVGAGIAGAIVGRIPILGTPWIWWSIILFSVSGVAFVWQVAPLQIRLRAMAREAAAGTQMDWARYRALSLRWELWGLLALLTPLAAVVLMVLKPA